MHCGIIDRTRSLNSGFNYVVLDPIPKPRDDQPEFADLCDARGRWLVAESLRTSRDIDVLWSGGIDSTTALIAVLKAATHLNARDRVRVLLSMDSVLEHPRFFLDHISTATSFRSIAQPVSAYLDPARLTVTGEHGDQLFGSQLLEPWVRRGLAGEDYRDLLPVVMLERLHNPLNVRRVQRYLEPVFAASPVPLVSLFDAMWWLNFALKWQDVSLRLPALTGAAAGPVFQATHHFFRTDEFQRWALARSGREIEIWGRYKQIAKQYILEFTGDERYSLYKEKEDSLRNVMNRRRSPERFQIFMRGDFRPVVTGAPQPAAPVADSSRLPAFSRQLRRVLDGA